jgi:hypothetical protein
MARAVEPDLYVDDVRGWMEAVHRLELPNVITIKDTPVVHVPDRREPVARPRERRAATRRSGSRASPSDPDEPGELEVIPPAVFAAEVSRALGGAA